MVNGEWKLIYHLTFFPRGLKGLFAILFRGLVKQIWKNMA
jgi:hypothetical protein